MTNPSRLEQMFCAVLEKNSFAERLAYLDEACHDDPDLHRQVSRLLQAHHAAGDFLETPGHMLDGTLSTSRILSETIGARIGPYTLVEELGEGGMGAVFLAEQDSPVKRRVALKILKPGLDSRQVLRRFDAERQSLALMDHANIAKVLDAGVTPLGRPYFVMELVSGIPIAKYCDEHRLPIRARLELFVSVCHAIQHAHQKGIIHRDVKPSNVLICVQEDQATATVKVIDFGVAKVLFQQLSGDSVHTEIGQIIGTLEYMSPEQAGLSDLDIDTRADIYSLGVLLYELLTGTTPVDRRALPGVPLTELLRMIREVEPPKPSSRLAQSETCRAPRGLLHAVSRFVQNPIAALPSLDRPGRRREASKAPDAARPSPTERDPRFPPTTGTVERVRLRAHQDSEVQVLVKVWFELCN
jgi:serine/threonine protein kinase